MLPNSVEPGTRLVDRYLLEEILGEAGGTAYWRARDELLDRRVGVCLLADGPERAEEILRAARKAAVVSDPRFLRILDANETDGVVYVVNEWVKANSLADLLAHGPLPAADARALALEIAEALATAHAEGLAHLCLAPENVLRTSHGQIKISGLAVDAAVRGIDAVDEADSAQLDTQGCAAVLYAALTGRWPADSASRLAPAPRENGELCSPRQVRAGIPHDLDELACRGLGAHLRDPSQALHRPEEFAALLAAGQGPERARGVSTSSEQTQAIRPGDTPPVVMDTPVFAAPYDDESQGRRGFATKLAWIGVVLVLLLGLGLTGYQLATGGFGDGNSQDSTQATDKDKPDPTPEPLRVAQVSTLDPPPGGNGEENNARAGRVIDGDPTTQWTTKTYNDPFGPSGLKDGVGLLLDLGSSQSVQSVELVLGDGSTDLELRVAEEPGTGPEDYRVVAQKADSSGQTQLRPEEPVRARYVLLWFTSLPAVDASNYRGTVAEVVIRG